MPLQDLTPQLRTRLTRMERLVGWFVALAILLMMCGLAYYLYQTAVRRGWFLAKVPYYTYVEDASGLKVGDRVRMMGFDIGEIVEIDPMPPYSGLGNVFVRFVVVEPYFGYIWTDSKVRVGAADFLGSRYLEVTKGETGPATYGMYRIEEWSLDEVRRRVAEITGTADEQRYKLAQEVYDPKGSRIYLQNDPLITVNLEFVRRYGLESLQVFDYHVPVNPPRWVWSATTNRYFPLPDDFKGYELRSDESPALTERLQALVDTVENALPQVLAITNRVNRLLDDADTAARHAADVLAAAQPAITNAAQASLHLARITANLTNAQGSLGEWLLPDPTQQRVDQTLDAARATLDTTRTNLAVLSSNLTLSLINLANLTSNLHAQVAANTNLVTAINQVIIDTDDFVQGLKRHWLLRSAFKDKSKGRGETNAFPRKLRSPRDASSLPRRWDGKGKP